MLSFLLLLRSEGRQHNYDSPEYAAEETSSRNNNSIHKIRTKTIFTSPRLFHMPVRLSLPLSLSLCLFRGSFSLQEIVYYNTSACKCYQIVSRLLILMPLSRKEKRREESPNSFFIFFHFLFYPRGRFRSSLLDILQFSLLSASDILLFSLIFFRFPICTGYSVFSFVCLLVV